MNTLSPTNLSLVKRVMVTIAMAAIILTAWLIPLRQGHADERTTITMGVIPFEQIRLTAEKFKGVVKAVEAATGKKVEWYFPTSYASLIEAQRRGFIDIAYYGPESYVKAHKISDGKITAFATAVWGGGPYRKQQPGYQSYIIVKADSPYHTIADLKGKVLALTSPSSTSGNLVPKVELGKKLGEKLSNFFGSMFYAGSHTGAQLAVLHGKADAAAVADVTLDWSVDSGAIKANTFRVLWRSSVQPLDPFAWRQDLLSNELKSKILQAFLNLSKTPEGRKFFEETRTVKMMKTDDKNFDGVREILAERNKWE